jgi:antitoxin component of MazEF toxin-antitoxin module
MVVQVQKSGNTFSFTLPQQAVEELALVDGSSIEVQPATARIRYASVAEAMRVHREMEPRHAEAYRELAK